MKFRFMDEHRSLFSVERMAQALKVSASGYYAFRARGESKRNRENRKLMQAIQEAFRESHRNYGSPRITALLRKRGYTCGENRVAKLMRSMGLQGRRRKGYRGTTKSSHSHRKFPNLLNQNFRCERPNTIWCSDITYIPTREGWLYLAVTLDLHSRKIVGWEVDERLSPALTIASLKKAITRRKPSSGLLHHSDQGLQYGHPAYQGILKQYGFLESMSRKGNCYDNAPVESFFKTLKTECINQERYATREEAKRSLFAYIEGFYNRKRLHSALGYNSPEEFERQYELTQ